MFVILHIPGWHFMGVLWDNLTNPAGGALSIFLVSLCFGYASHRSSSVMGGVLAPLLEQSFLALGAPLCCIYTDLTNHLSLSRGICPGILGIANLLGHRSIV